MVISGLAKSSQKTLDSARGTYSMIEKLERDIQESNTAVNDTVDLPQPMPKVPGQQVRRSRLPGSHEPSELDDCENRRNS